MARFLHIHIHGRRAPARINSRAWARTLSVHDAALALKTAKNYAGAVRMFKQWASAERVSYSTPSVPEVVLCAYAASMAGLYSAGHARAQMSGLRYWHERRNVAWLGSPRLLRVLKGVEALAPSSTRRDDRPPVTEAMLDEALDQLDEERPFDVCVAATLLSSFWAQLRLGEALADSKSKPYDFARLPAGKSLKLRHDAGGLPSQITSALWLPSTKCARAGEWVWLARHHNDPSLALQEHLRVNRIGPDDPLFAYRHDTTGVLTVLTRGAFLSRLNEIWLAAGMQRVTGHCFRIGGTTALLRAGVEPDVVKIAGRWKSDSFLRYWRAVDSIIASHVDLCEVSWARRRPVDTPVF